MFQKIASALIFAAFLGSSFLGSSRFSSARAAEGNGLDSSPALFSVLAAINMAGYNADLQSPSTHPIRLALRKALESRDIPSLAELKRYYRDHKRENDTRTLSLFISYALCVDGPPNFKFRMLRNNLPPEVVRMEDFSGLMQRFHKEAGIDELYKQAQPALEQAMAAYQEPVARALLEANGYFRSPTSGYTDRRFQIYVDLLGAPNQIQTRAYGADTFVVATASPEPLVDDVRHAYLQYLTGPLVLRHKDAIETKKGLGDFAQPAPVLSEVYKQDFLLLLEKSLIKAVEARLVTGYGSNTRRQQMVEQALAEGYVLTPYFAEALVLYEKQEQSLRLYFTELINGINLKKEDKRLETVKFATEPVVRRAKSVPAAAPEELPAIEKLLNDAEVLYEAKKLPQARQKFLEALGQTENQVLRAKAYYGLARVAIRENDPELGERLFRKTLELSPDPATKAWSLVYLGRLADISGDADQATRQYQAAMAVEGGSDKARETAGKGLKGEFRRKGQ